MFASAVRSAIRGRLGECSVIARKSVISYCYVQSEHTVCRYSVAPLQDKFYSAKDGYSSSGRSRQFPSTPPICLAGILSFLGLESKEKVDEDPVVHTIKLGILALQREQYKKAEQMLHLALKMSQERMDAQAEVYCFDVMAEIALAYGDLEKAEKLYVEVMQRLIATGTGKDDNAIIEISAKLANIFSSRHDDKKAEQGYMFCIETQQKKISNLIENLDNVELTPAEQDSVALWGMCMDWFAKHLIARGRYSEARVQLSQSLRAARKVFGENHEQTLVVKNDLALLSAMLKDYTESIRLLEEVLAAVDDDDQCDDLAVFLCNLGESYLKSGNFNQAEKCCARAKKLAEKRHEKVTLKAAENCIEELQRKRSESSTTADGKNST